MNDFFKNISFKYSDKITAILNKKVSFALSGVTNCSKLVFLAQLLLKNKKKFIFITETEQNALKFQNDLKHLFDINAVIFPYQDGSIYDSNSKNLYKYAKQIQIILNAREYSAIIIPRKALIEKFPDMEFFKENSITFKVNDEIDIDELAKNLVKMGYKRKTLVADMGEFSIRGDIIDIFPLNDNPYRLELWGDTISDIRIFNNSTQKSINKTDTAIIQPIYKFILNNNSYKKIEKLIDIENESQADILENLKNLH